MNGRSPEAHREDLVILPFSVNLHDRELPLFLNVQKVLRVEEANKVRPLAQILPPFVGVFDFDGLAVPTLILADLLDKSEAKDEAGRAETLELGRVVICEAMGRVLGMVVRQTKKVSRRPAEDIQAPPRLWQDLDMTYLCALTKEPEGFRYMLDLEAIFARLGVRFENAPEQGTSALAGKRVLLVEDSRVFQNLAANALRKEGAVVDIAQNGAEGLQLATQTEQGYDLILLDIEMPVMNGVEMARKYRATVREPAPILFHSAISNPVLAGDILNEGLGDYLPKFEEHAVIEKLKGMVKKAA